MPYESDGGTVWAAANNNNAIAITLPATRPVGSVLLFIAWCRLITAAAPAPSGYTLLGTWTSGTASGGRVWLYAKEVIGGEAAPTVTPAGVTGTSGDAWGACIFCYSGVDLSGGISAILDGTPTTTDASGTTTCTYAAITTAIARSTVVRFLARWQDLAVTFTPTADHTEREDASTTNRLGGNFHLQDKETIASGSQAAVTVTPSSATATRYLAISLALKPTPPPPEPSGPVLDDFNRANATPPSGKWTGSWANVWRITSNQLAHPTATWDGLSYTILADTVDSVGIWEIVSIGADSTHLQLFINRIELDDTGYFVDIMPITGTTTFYFRRRLLGADTVIGSTVTGAPGLVAGDKIALQRYGARVAFWHWRSGVWSCLADRTDPSPLSLPGAPGIFANGAFVVDNFAGSPFTPPWTAKVVSVI